MALWGFCGPQVGEKLSEKKQTLMTLFLISPLYVSVPNCSSLPIFTVALRLAPLWDFVSVLADNKLFTRMVLLNASQ